ncbi:MAG: ClpP family protease [Saprospiraceae bacterium]
MIAISGSKSMIHQPSGGTSGQLSAMEITYKLYKELQKDIYQIRSQTTGQTYEQIAKDSDRDNWMRAEVAKEYGLIDAVLERL